MISVARSDVEVSTFLRTFGTMGIETQYVMKSKTLAMQKSKSSSSVMHQGGKLMAKKIFRSRSKSHSRPAVASCSWTPQGGCVWSNLTGKQVVLGATSLLQLSDVERKVLQKVALAKLQALNLGVSIKVPTENAGVASTKSKRRPYLLKRKALTTGIFDANNKEGSNGSGGLVFGIPLTQCVENDRISRAASRTSPFGTSTDEASTIGRVGSRSSFSSLIEAARGEKTSSCESLMLRERIVGSVPGLLDAISCGGSTGDLGPLTEEEAAVPRVLAACFRHLERHGLRTLGIFRVSTSRKRVRQLREDFDAGKENVLEEEQCPHDVATLLKEYLRDLPDPLLCRDLYQAFVQTQRIRNRRLQFEALQHLIQLLPIANRDTLFALLGFLALVAQNSPDAKDEAGECIPGNKMDSNNLATVFAPNILHCIKSGNSKESSADKPEDRIDIINVIRILIDHYKHLFSISAELLDEIYVHMMDSHPEDLEQLLDKREIASAAADESVEELDSESYSAPWSPTSPTSEMSIDNVQTEVEPKKTIYSREECMHEKGGLGGPDIGMIVSHGYRPRSSKKRTEGITISIKPRTKTQKEEDFVKARSSSMESTSSTHTDDLARAKFLDEDRRRSSPQVINAVLRIPVQTTQQPQQPFNPDEDIPYIGDNVKQQITIGLVRTPTAPPRRRQRSISGSDSSASSFIPVTSQDSAIGSSLTQPTSTCSSTVDAGACSSPPSWASTPPTSPDSVQTANYMPEELKQKTPSVQKVSFQEVKSKQVEPKYSPSISNIGNAVMKSTTANFEKKTKVEGPKGVKEKKKYTKRRYTDSRHQTRHIPDAEALEAQQVKKEEGQGVQQVYKRRELISSVPLK